MKHSRAFTLLEMVVAIGIFAVIAVVSYASLNRFLDDSAVLEADIDELRQLQLAFSLLEQDMRFMSQRIVRDAYGDQEPLLILNNINDPGELLRFTTARRNVALPGTSALQRTAYRWEKGDFIRVNWRVLDHDQGAREIKHLLLTDVESVSVNVLQNLGGVMQSLPAWEAIDRLPDGVEWQIRMANGKQYRRVFEIKHVF
ncbi:MAG: type II secretion system minor pseudopilin GspJ [Gammaproteobacteria bacterium]|nr:type II secretion system minor pseudopilin GspJ [Gammaproteobacteria bacterium]